MFVRDRVWISFLKGFIGKKLYFEHNCKTKGKYTEIGKLIEIVFSSKKFLTPLAKVLIKWSNWRAILLLQYQL